MNISSSLSVLPVKQYTKLQEQLLGKILQSVAIAPVESAKTLPKVVGNNLDIKV